jgi:membrane-bound lytic murein transglycosylase D
MTDEETLSMFFKRTAIALALSQLGALSAFAADQPPAFPLTQIAQLAITGDTMPTKVLAPSAPNIPAVQLAPAIAVPVPITVAAPQSAAPMAIVPLGIAPANAAVPEAPATADTRLEGVAPSANSIEAIQSDANKAGEVAPDVLEVVKEAQAPLPPTDLWDRIRGGFAMQDLDDEYVRKWEQWYSSRPEYMQRVVDRGSKYWFYIVTEIERRGMPLEIALLPVVESAFVTHANSSAAAAGIWQFIPSTGKNFGMKQDWWADSRRDIVQATTGALDYLQKLHGMFGDWQLALASYNWGEGSVGRAVAANQAAGKPGTYSSLNMPNETRNYLPKLQAIKNIVNNPSAFGVKLASVPNQPYFKTISIAKHIDVDHAIKMAEVSKEEFVALNPAHNRPVIGGRAEHQILLPADKADLFISRLDAGDRPLVSWMAYKTKGGDRLQDLAQRFGITVDSLRAVNGIRSTPASLPAGYNLLVPSGGPSAEALGSLENAVFTKLPEYTPSANVALPKIHRAGKGDTLASVAKRYGVSAMKLAQWNRLGKNANLSKGALIAVSGPMPMQTRLVKVKKGGRYVMVKQTVPAVRMIAGKGGKGKVVYAKSGKRTKVAAKRGKRRA